MSCACGPGADEPRVRIRVCMSHYFEDERARCLLLVPARRRVRWLARRLRALFPLPPRTALLCRGHLLPRDESLALLDADDLVEVVPRRSSRERAEGAVESQDAVGCLDRARLEGKYEGNELRFDDADDPIDSVDHGLQTADVPPSASTDPDEPDELHVSKRRALAVLEQYCGPIAKTVTAQPRARRRRVRRRRRPTACDAPEPIGDTGGEQESSGDAMLCIEASGNAGQCRNACDADVQRDEAQGNGVQCGEASCHEMQRSEVTADRAQPGGAGGDVVGRGAASGGLVRAPRLVRALTTAAMPVSFDDTNRVTCDYLSVPSL